MLTRQQRQWMIKIEQVFNCVIPYVHDVDDRNSISLVCRRLGFRRGNHITPWIKEIAVKFTCLKELQIHGLVVFREDLERLATSRDKDLRVLNINKCRRYWEEGLVHVAKYCNQLRILSLEGPGINNEDFGKWLHELAIHNTVLESFHCRFNWFKYYTFDVQDLTILERKCSKSLVSLKISPCSLSLLGDAFRHALRPEDFSGGYYGKREDYVDFKLPPNMHYSGPHCCCFLVKKCPNLEVLYTKDICGDTGMQVIVLFCKKIRKFTHARRVTGMGLIDLAHGCHNLEYIKVRRLIDISNEAMECVGTHLKNLRNFWVRKYGKTDILLDNGIELC
ncbi:leucine-rich repeat, cysteine-containing subtype protein [Tanacetum coccineum]